MLHLDGVFSALRADAGMSPRRATFLFEQPKRKAKKLPLMPASLRLRLRATCGARAWAAPHNSLRAARFVQTNAASQFTKQLHSAVQLPAHALCASALAKGVEGEEAEIASLSHYRFDSCWRALIARQRLKTLKAPSTSTIHAGCWPPTALIPAFVPQSLADQGRAMFEGAQRPSFRPAPPVAGGRRLPAAKRRDGNLGIAFLLGYFALARQRKMPRPPGRDPVSDARHLTICRVARTALYQ